ncbi:MAG: ABC transporter substrate-binding protein [Chloroflexi bacterium]|nr:ABC transporter substrate-binding protein [Chloroflexota bacterium]
MLRKMVLPLALLTLGLLLGAACRSDAPASVQATQEPQKIIFMAGFKPQANLPFVAAYIAKEKGYFAEQGLDVEIRHASTGEHLKLLLAGDIAFTTADAGSVLRRRSDPDVPIAAFALFGQRGQNGYVAMASSGLSTPNDWEGKTFGYKTSVPPEYLAILEATGTNRSKIQEVSVGFDPRVLTEGQVDILAIFKSNEPDTIRRLGFDVVLWDPADFGIPTLGLTYIAHTDTTKQDPELVRKFLKATLKGFQDALGDPEGALDIVMQYAPDENREHQQYMLAQELADAVGPVTDEHGLGWMTDEQWNALYDEFIKHGAITKPFDYKTAFDDSFLNDVYDGKTLEWP